MRKPRRSIISACVASLGLFVCAGHAVAANKTFCVANSAQFYNAMQYWMSSNDDNVIVNAVQGTYGLTLAEAHYAQTSGGNDIGYNLVAPGDGTAALVLNGGYVSTHSACDGRLHAGGVTIFDGGGATDLFFAAKGNISIDSITVQNMTTTPSNPYYAVDFKSSGNGVSLNNFISRNNAGKTDTMYLQSETGLLITDSLFANDGCPGGSITCAALYMESFDASTNAKIISTTIASSAAFGLHIAAAVSITGVNDILWNNASGDVEVDSGGNAIFSFSDFSSVSGGGTFLPGIGNIAVNPLLKSDFTLQTSPTLSPAINAAATSLQGYAYPATDLAGNPRRIGSRVDLGPYESSYLDQQKFVVTNTTDSPLPSSGSLRAAVLNANSAGLPAQITFAIPGGGSGIFCNQTIVLLSPLPDVTVPMIVDATTIASAAPNTATNGAFNANLCITLSSSGAAYAFHTPSNAPQDASLTILGIAFFGFTDAAVSLQGGSGHFFGGDIFSSNRHGVHVWGNSSYTVVGSAVPGAANQFVNQTGIGIYFDGVGYNYAVNNVIGIGTDGMQHQGNVGGIALENSPGNVLFGNFIGNSSSEGLLIDGAGSQNNLVQSNYIGYDLAGGAQPNGGPGVVIDSDASSNVIGSSAQDNNGGNQIEYNAGPGISILSGTNNSALANTLIFNGGNTYTNGLAVDLGSNGPNANVSSQPTTGPNGWQDHPVMTGSYVTRNARVMQGTLYSASNTTYRIDFYETLASGGYAGSDPRGIAGVFLGTGTAVTNGRGYSTFSIDLPLNTINAGYISATATSLVASGSTFTAQNTSEISNAVATMNDEIFRDGFDASP